MQLLEKQQTQKILNYFLINEQVAKIPVNILVENSPMYDRKWKKSKLPKKNKIKNETLNRI